MARHVLHGFYIPRLPVFQLCLECGLLRVEYANIAIYMMNIGSYLLNVFLSTVYFSVQHEQLLQPLLHVFLIGLERLLLLSYLFLNGRTLFLQSSDRRIAIRSVLTPSLLRSLLG